MAEGTHATVVVPGFVSELIKYDLQRGTSALARTSGSVHIQVNLKSRTILMRQLSIGEVARRTGIRTSALRYYEETGILPTPARVSGRRCYDTDAIRRVDVLRFAQQAGFTLREIKTLFHGFGADTP